MNVYVGKIVNTHGIKGELRILSNIEKKEQVFRENTFIYIGKNKEKHQIRTYRKHKNFDMITIDQFCNINDVLKFKGEKVYVDRDVLNLKKDEYILDDLLYLEVVCNHKSYGTISNIYDNNGNTLLEVNKKYYIPYHGDYIKHVDLDKKQIEVVNIEDLII